MKHIILLLTALCLYTDARSCSCASQWDGRGFCSVVADAQNNEMFCVVQVKVVSWYHWGMNVKVLDQVRSSASKDTIVVWGDNGACCRPYLNGTFHLGDTIILCLERTDYMGNTTSTSQPDRELYFHYVLQGCGAYYMRYKNGYVTGAFDNDEHSDTLEYNDFKSRVHHCLTSTSKVGTPETTGFTISPNPAGEVISISSPAAFSEVRLYNGVGQCVLTQNTTGNHVNINVAHLAPGLYSLHVYDADKKTISHHKVVRQ